MDDKREWDGTPVRLACGHEVLDPNQVHYEDYISLGALLALRKPFAVTTNASNPHARPQRDFFHPDEELFIVAHQVSELALTQAETSLATAVTLVAQDVQTAEFKRGWQLILRAAEWMRVAVSVFSPLRTMDAEAFGSFREHLAPASGAESISFRRIELIAGMRENSPYVDERGNSYTYRGFLDRGPGPDVNDPKTRWWTGELTELASKPSIWEVLQRQTAVLGLSLEDIYRISQLKHQCRPTGATANQDIKSGPLRSLGDACGSLQKYYGAWRYGHRAAVADYVGEKPGTGHTTGMSYIDSVSRITCLFPGLANLVQKYPCDAVRQSGW